jgi:uncharacterized membrane protein
MNILEQMPFAARDALVAIGLLTAVAGMFVRENREASRGIGMAMIVVGAMLVLAGPVGHALHWW